METYDNAITKEELFSVLDYSRQAQKISLGIFKFFHDICKNNNIQFVLCEGSLLGCIRHKGFIPWDDDIDIYMTILNFSKLQKIISTNNYNIKLHQLSRNQYFFKNTLINKEIDIFLPDFKKEIYANINDQYTESSFENLNVSIPKNYLEILSKLYNNWQEVCCICNHKISKENFQASYGYYQRFYDKYKKLPLDLANTWFAEYEKTLTFKQD